MVRVDEEWVSASDLEVFGPLTLLGPDLLEDAVVLTTVIGSWLWAVTSCE